MDYQEVLRRWLAGDAVCSIARGTGLDRKTVRRLIKIAREHGLKSGDPWPDDQAVSMFTGSVRRPGPPAQHSESERILLERRLWLGTFLRSCQGIHVLTVSLRRRCSVRHASLTLAFASLQPPSSLKLRSPIKSEARPYSKSFCSRESSQIENGST